MIKSNFHGIYQKGRKEGYQEALVWVQDQMKFELALNVVIYNKLEELKGKDHGKQS